MTRKHQFNENPYVGSYCLYVVHIGIYILDLRPVIGVYLASYTIWCNVTIHSISTVINL